MKTSFRIAAMCAFLLAPLAAHAQTPTIIGTLTNFDVVNETEGEKEGFQIELEGIHGSDITRVFGRSGTTCLIRFCGGTIVDVPATATSPGGVIIRWTASYDAATGRFFTDPTAPGNGTGTPSTFGTHPNLVTGEMCWSIGLGSEYPTSGCEHFGISTSRNPTKTTYRWLVGDPATGAIAPAVIAPGVQAPPVTIAHPIAVVIPPAVPGGAPEVQAVIRGADPEVIPGAQFPRRYGPAQWVKVYKTELGRNADLDELVGGHPNNVVPNAANAVPETEWKLLQFDISNPANGASQLSNHGSPGGGSRAVVRRYEFYQYTGPVVAPGGTTGKNGGPKLSTDGLEDSRCPRDPETLECIEPGPGELGDYVGSQMAADNLAGAAVLIDQAITGFTLPATLTFGDPAFTVSGTGGASGNPVTFSASGACAILDPANANVVSITGTGLCEVIASQAGNAAYAPAPLVTETVTVEKAAATVAFDAGTLHQTYDGLVKTVSTTTSPVGLQVDISFTGTPQGAGSYPVTATINELNYTAGEATGTLTIDKATQSIVFGALADRTFGDAAFTVTASGGDAGNPVTFSALGACSVLDGLVTITRGGSCTITASQAGNDNYEAAADVPQIFSVAKATQTILFDALADRTFGDAPFTVSATGGKSGNQVTFSAAGNCSAAGSLVTITGAGSCTVTASQAGNDSYDAAPDVPHAFAIGKASQTILFGALADRTFGDAPFSVSATGGGSGNAVTFAALGNCSVLGNLVTLTAPGSCTVTASQAGNANYTAAADVPRSFTIAAPPVNNPIVNPGDQVNREGDEVELAIQVLGVRSSNRGRGGDNRGTFAALNLPGGLDIDKNGVIRGHVKKNTARAYDVTVMFTLDGQTYAQKFVWTILAGAKDGKKDK
jgi:hypothetical protein